MTKFKEYYERMVKTNQKNFDRFTQIHLKYSIDPQTYQEEFNREGEKILKIIREWENKLCQHSEKAGFGSYSGRLAEKFQEEIRRHFPKIDSVGIINPDARPSSNNQNDFFLKKINLK